MLFFSHLSMVTCYRCPKLLRHPSSQLFTYTGLALWIEMLWHMDYKKSHLQPWIPKECHKGFSLSPYYVLRNFHLPLPWYTSIIPAIIMQKQNKTKHKPLIILFHLFTHIFSCGQLFRRSSHIQILEKTKELQCNI